MNRPRFGLRSLFVALTLVAVLLGYSQWRRYRILHEAAELESQGFTLLWQDGWMHSLWPIVPSEAKFEYYTTSDGKLSIGSDVYLVSEDVAINAHNTRGTDRLNALGVESVRLDREGVRGNSSVSIGRGD